jgi:hypothetical protein
MRGRLLFRIFIQCVALSQLEQLVKWGHFTEKMNELSIKPDEIRGSIFPCFWGKIRGERPFYGKEPSPKPPVKEGL